MNEKSKALAEGAAWRTQRGVLRDVMLSAAECETWLTLRELGDLTHYPPASISAQLRHLRKPQYGGYALEKRRRVYAELGRDKQQGAVWEYRLGRACDTSYQAPGESLEPPLRGGDAVSTEMNVVLVSPEIGGHRRRFAALCGEPLHARNSEEREAAPVRACADAQRAVARKAKGRKR